jgi:hypothetical protein
MLARILITFIAVAQFASATEQGPGSVQQSESNIMDQLNECISEVLQFECVCDCLDSRTDERLFNKDKKDKDFFDSTIFRVPGTVGKTAQECAAFNKDSCVGAPNAGSEFVKRGNFADCERTVVNTRHPDNCRLDPKTVLTILRILGRY